jgi:excisionase family DNA binding protein
MSSTRPVTGGQRPPAARPTRAPAAAEAVPDAVPAAVPAAVPPRDGPHAQVKFLTVADVAALMRVSKMTVYRLVHSGELTAVRVGRSFRVPEKAVHDYLRDAFIEAG